MAWQALKLPGLLVGRDGLIGQERLYAHACETHPLHGVTLPGFRLLGWQRQKNILQCREDLSCYQLIKNKVSYRLIVIDKACQSDNFSSLPTLPCRPIICSILIIAPVDWTADSPIVLACNFTAYFISHLWLLFSKWQPKSAFTVSAPT